MLSPTNYHIPSQIAEGLAQYHTGAAELETVFSPEEIGSVYGVLEEITDPQRKDIVFGVGQVIGHELFLIDDHSRPKRTIGIGR
jgi:hypothetical protein